MKIEIITYSWSNNLGALIQSYCLKNYIIQNFNYEVFFNSYSSRSLISRERKSQINRENLPKIFYILRKKFILYQWKKKILNLNKPSKNSSFSSSGISLYGSDEIWNFSSPIVKKDLHYFGALDEKKKISYAVSFGSASLSDEYKKKDFEKYLKKFDAISVRDDNSQLIIEELTGKKVPIVLDPCFLFDEEIEEYTNNYLQKILLKNFILIYGEKFDEKDIQQIKSIAVEKKMYILSVSYFNRWADYNLLDIDPFQFIFLIKKSSMVFTSMFHGVMLSYKYKKQFWIIKDPYRENKLNFFLNNLSLKDRFLEDYCDSILDYKKSEKKFLNWIDNSKKFLSQNLVLKH